MGKDAPADFIIASMSTGIALIMLPAIVPLFHRLPRRTQAKTLFALAFVQNVIVLVLASPFWGAYDRMHPKRIALQYHYNVSLYSSPSGLLADTSPAYIRSGQRSRRIHGPSG